MFCRNCGNQLKDTDRFCPACGTPNNSAPYNQNDTETDIDYNDFPETMEEMEEYEVPESIRNGISFVNITFKIFLYASMAAALVVFITIFVNKIFPNIIECVNSHISVLELIGYSVFNIALIALIFIAIEMFAFYVISSLLSRKMDGVIYDAVALIGDGSLPEIKEMLECSNCKLIERVIYYNDTLTIVTKRHEYLIERESEYGGYTIENTDDILECYPIFVYLLRQVDRSLPAEEASKLCLTIKRRSRVYKFYPLFFLIMAVIVAASTYIKETYVNPVMKASYSDYDCTFEDVFDHYFENNHWKFVKNSNDGWVVRFSGEFKKNSYISIEYTIYDNGMFEISSMQIDDVTYNSYEIGLVINYLFYAYDNDISIGVDELLQGNDEKQDNIISDFNEESSASYNGDMQGRSDIINDMFVGTWWDINSQRCNMEIEAYDDGIFSIEINWSSGASENTAWHFTGVYDDEYNELEYYGTCVNEFYNDDGTMKITTIYDDGSGSFYFGADDRLYWYSLNDSSAERCVFERAEEY